MITTEATIRAICMTLYKVWPSGNYYLFCLGKSEEYPMIIDCNIDDFII